MTSYLNIDAVLLDNSPVATHIANCPDCKRDVGIRELCVSFYTLLFVPRDDNKSHELTQEQMIRAVQMAISEITKKCEEGK